MAHPELPADRDGVPRSVPALESLSPPLFTPAGIRAIEAQWARAHPHDPLMERAGAAAAQLAATLAASDAPVLVLAGPGNNGGDALVAARRVATAGRRVIVVSRADPTRLPGDAARAMANWCASGGTVCNEIPSGTFSLVVDGLFGVGLDRPVEGIARQWIEQINALSCPKLALDVPSGLDSESGAVHSVAVRATTTLTFLGLKPGLLTGDGVDYAGYVLIDALCTDAAARPAGGGFALTGLEPRHVLPVRRKNSHKGDYGSVAIIGGAPGMVGAALIAGRAALRQGAGSVTVGALDERIVVDFGEPRLMFAAAEALLERRPTALAIGPGLGQTPRAHALLRMALEAPCPLVLDADALNVLANDRQLAAQVAERRAPTLLTPHPGEAARLLGATSGEIQANRVVAARRLSEAFRAHVALKGAGTVIAHPGGTYAINTSGGPWLAQAGSGDRLTGMTAALLAQGMGPAEALEAAVWLHGQPEISTSVS